MKLKPDIQFSGTLFLEDSWVIRQRLNDRRL